MKAIERRLTELEKKRGGNTAYIVIWPGETEEHAREKYYAANLKCKEAKEEVIFRVKYIGVDDEMD